MLGDKILLCRDCDKEFVFTSGEREFYMRRGFETEPIRCPKCRQLKKEKAARHRDSNEVFEVICSCCGTVNKLLFEPRHDMIIICNECRKKSVAHS